MSGVLYGLDTSHYQGAYDYAAAKTAGATFAGIQLTVGTGDDALGATNCVRAAKAGLLVMAYHFATAGDGAAQADHFVSRFAALPHAAAGLPVLDIEPKQGCTKRVVLDFLDRWEKRVGSPLVIYSGPGAFRSVMGTRSFDLARRYSFIAFLWNADYRGGRIRTAADPRFDVQYVGGLYGYGGFSQAPIVQFGPMFGTDGDAFAGNAAELAALFGAVPPKPVTVTYRYGAIPNRRGLYRAKRRKYIRSTPGIPQNAPLKNVVARMAVGDTFRAHQSLTKANGHIWLGDETGTRWVLKDRRLETVKP